MYNKNKEIYVYMIVLSISDTLFVSNIDKLCPGQIK
jgi:hypothetical protein